MLLLLVVSIDIPRPDLSRLRRVPAAEIETKSYVAIQKCIISKSFLTSIGLLGAPREPSEHYLEEVANRSRLFTKKTIPELIVAPF